MQPSPLDPVASERLSHADKLFTSDLSINEFALLHGAGFEPIELVMGVSVYHVGYQFTGLKTQSELPVLTEATYRARWNAMARMQAEAIKPQLLSQSPDGITACCCGLKSITFFAFNNAVAIA